MLLLLLAVSSACSGLGGEPVIVATIPPQQSANAEIAAVMTLGGEVWMANCAECHGQTGLGTTDGAPLPDLTNYTDEQILASITNGVRDEMPAFGAELSPEQLTAVRTYARMVSVAIARGMINAGTPSAVAAQPTPIDATAAAAQPQETEEAAAAQPAASATAAVTGVVSGQITMGTAGVTLPPNLPVTLHVVKSEFSEQSFEVVTGADGTYTISDVPFDATYQYVATVPYGDLSFVSNIVAANPAAPTLDLPITLYEAGAPDDAISINGVNAQVIVQDSVLQVFQIVSFVNTSDRVYFNRDVEGGTSVRVLLPRNATFLPTRNTQYVLSGDGTQMYSTSPLVPGQVRAVHAAYALPYGQSAAVEQMFTYPLSGPVEVDIASPGVTLTGEGFAALGQTQNPASGQAVNSYSALLTRAAGSSIRFDLAGVPPVAGVAGDLSQVSPLAYVLIGAGISALVIAAILYLRERLARKPAAPSSNVIGDLMEKIAALDAQHKAGKVDGREYEQQRRALKERLSLLMKEQ
jgi:mono/diheme cytochrome c family protein